MNRLSFLVVAGAAMILPRPGQTADPFEEKLNPDRQIVQALNRLTFGPRPGDIEEVRRTGLARWIQQQLHPDQIVENPVLEQRLALLKTLQTPVADLISSTSQDMSMGMMAIEPPFAALN